MFRPSLRTNLSLTLLAVFSIILFIIIGLSKGADYAEQKNAAERMERSIEKVSLEFRELLKENKVSWDKKTDPKQLGLVGPETSPIITSRAVLSEKQRAINPNLAAVFVKWLKEAELEAGDYVAVGVTGSSPAVNIALYSAMKELDLKPVIITALSSSRYGASDVNFTWLDMEKAIYSETGFKSYAASRGGNRDIAAGMNSEGKELLGDIIDQNNLQLIEGNRARIVMFEKALPKGQEYKAFINIGASVGNVGSVVSAGLLKEGVNYTLPELEAYGVLEYFTEKNIPTIHFFRGQDTFDEYYLSEANSESQKIGKGNVYGYSWTVALICLILLIIAIALVIIYDRHDRHFMANIVGHRED
ncbi:poly-gamma-glutamate system protein [bacterium]|nr:poly-gamma-glutamate system protein [bacterium]